MFTLRIHTQALNKYETQNLRECRTRTHGCEVGQAGRMDRPFIRPDFDPSILMAVFNYNSPV